MLSAQSSCLTGSCTSSLPYQGLTGQLPPHPPPKMWWTPLDTGERRMCQWEPLHKARLFLPVWRCGPNVCVLETPYLGDSRESSSRGKKFKKILEMWVARGEDDDVELKERKCFYSHYRQKLYILIKKPKSKHKKTQIQTQSVVFLLPGKKVSLFHILFYNDI